MKGANAGEKHKRCRALTEEELATQEMQVETDSYLLTRVAVTWTACAVLSVC